MDYSRKRITLTPYMAMVPGMLVFVVVYIGCTAFSILLSFTSSGMFPSFNFVGLSQYQALLAGMRGIDEDIWKATRVDGIPKWRTYWSVVLPMLSGALATSLVLLSISVVKVYDLVIAMTNGGPGFASDMPAKFVMDNLFERQNAGLASAGVVVMLSTVLIVFAPVIFARSMRLRQRRV